MPGLSGWVFTLATIPQSPASTSLDSGPPGRPFLRALTGPLCGPSPQLCGDADQGTDEEVQGEDGGDQPAGGRREHCLPQTLSPATKHCKYMFWVRALAGAVVRVGWMDAALWEGLRPQGGVSHPLLCTSLAICSLAKNQFLTLAK